MLPDSSPRIQLGARWQKSGAVWTRGWGYPPAGTVFRGAALAKYIADASGSFVHCISTLGGNFAVVLQTDEALYISVDRIRSIPLFYGRKTNSTWVVSDDARFVASELPQSKIDSTAAVELMLQSCVTGSDTLIAGLHQVRAGEIVRIEKESTEKIRYACYGTGSILQESEDVLVEQAANVLEEAFDRFIESVAGQPVAMPLSGGLDSRLIAARLVASGRTDTTCFTYGPRHGQEVRLSKRVAEHLGLPWYRVSYSAKRWSGWAQSVSFRQFQRDATGLVAIEHEQDWPAVQELKNDRIIQPGTIFVPGHAGDFLGGSHLFAEPSPIETDAIEWILTKYYTEWPRHALPPMQLDELKARIAAQLLASEPADAFTAFGWQERQAKMIANSVRVYEHHGFGWRLPFWSHPPVFDFWSRIPLALRRGSYLYRRAVQKLMDEDLFTIPTTSSPRSDLTARATRILDGGLGRYGIWAGRHPLLTSTTLRIKDIARIADTDVAEAIEPLIQPVRSLPLQRVTINALLALGQLNRLTQESL